MSSRFLRCLPLLAIAALVSACVTSKMDAQAKSEFRRVYFELQLSDATVVPPEGGALAAVAGKSPPPPEVAAKQFQEIVKSKVRLSALLEEQARKELVAKGYQIAASPAEADAKLRFIVYHGLGYASGFSNARGISMTLNMEMRRATNDKRFLFGIANQVKDASRQAQIKAARHEEWFFNDAMVTEQYRVISQDLVSQVLSGL